MKEENKRLEADTKHGITVGLIDSIITIAAVLARRGDLHDQNSKQVREAMKNLYEDDNVSWLLTRKTAKQWFEDRKSISIAVESIKK